MGPASDENQNAVKVNIPRFETLPESLDSPELNEQISQKLAAVSKSVNTCIFCYILICLFIIFLYFCRFHKLVSQL